MKCDVMVSLANQTSRPYLQRLPSPFWIHMSTFANEERNVNPDGVRRWTVEEGTRKSIPLLTRKKKLEVSILFKCVHELLGGNIRLSQRSAKCADGHFPMHGNDTPFGTATKNDMTSTLAHLHKPKSL